MIVYQSLLGYLVHLDQTVIIPLQFALQRVQDLLHLKKEKKKEELEEKHEWKKDIKRERRGGDKRKRLKVVHRLERTFAEALVLLGKFI